MGTRSSKGGSEQLAALLRDRRTTSGLSRRDLAERSGLSYPYISQLETAYRLPSPKAMRALADALEVSVTELFDALPHEPAPMSAPPPPPSGAIGSSGHWMANPLRASQPRSAKPAERPSAVQAAIDALETVDPTERLASLSEVQAAIVASVVRDQST